MLYYVAYIPDLRADTIREYTKKFQKYLENIGVSVSNSFVEDTDDAELIDNLPDSCERAPMILARLGSDIYYGWDINKFNDITEPFKELVWVDLTGRALVGVLE